MMVQAPYRRRLGAGGQEKKVGDLSYFSGFHIKITVFIY